MEGFVRFGPILLNGQSVGLMFQLCNKRGNQTSVQPPTERGLHVLNCAEYFGLDRPNWVFGNKDNAGIIDTCMAGFPELNNSDGIDTIEKSKF